jgi:queuine tRNA-ribosyltransferase accessory subunit
MPPRVGVVQAAGTSSIPTPAPALFTNRGQLPNLPREILLQCLGPSDPPLLLQCALTDWFCVNPNKGVLGAELLRDLPTLGGVKSFAALPDSLTLLSIRAAASADFVTATPGKALVISADSPSHRPSVSPAQIVDLHCAMQTSFFESPSDSPLLHAPSKRIVPRSVTRASALLAETIDFLRASAKPAREQMFIAIQGGADPEQRALSAKSAAAASASLDGPAAGLVAGYTLAGLYCGESPAERWAAVEAAVTELPEHGVRVLAGHGGAPCDVLEAVARGVDVVESAYPFTIASDGYALDLDGGGAKINLRDRRWDRDGGVLVPGCACVACAIGPETGGVYTRAYIRHLLEVHEMMGETLLAAHNMRNYLDWFGRLRTAIETGEFDQFRRSFYEHREIARNETTAEAAMSTVTPV